MKAFKFIAIAIALLFATYTHGQIRAIDTGIDFRIVHLKNHILTYSMSNNTTYTVRVYRPA